MEVPPRDDLVPRTVGLLLPAGEETGAEVHRNVIGGIRWSGPTVRQVAAAAHVSGEPEAWAPRRRRYDADVPDSAVLTPS